MKRIYLSASSDLSSGDALVVLGVQHPLSVFLELISGINVRETLAGLSILPHVGQVLVLDPVPFKSKLSGFQPLLL